MRATIKEDRPHIVSGRVGGGGQIVTGTEFTVSHAAGSGLYNIRLLAPFRGPPVITATGEFTAPGATTLVESVDGRSFNVRVASVPGNALGDASFDFIATGIVA